jgi:hypothetical protein
MQLSQTVSMLLASILLVLSVADATPILNRSTPSKFITLPIKRYQYERKDLHPLIVSEQLVNRGLQRLARMSGGPEPPRELLERNLMRRVLSVEGVAGLERRFNRRSLDDDVVLKKRFNTYGVPAPAPIGNSLAVGSGAKSQRLAVTAANTPTANNSLGLDIEATDVSYLATIQIGNPVRNFSILMDSGSADFWVGSENCTSTAGGGCGDHVFLGPQSSTSFADSATPFSVRYGTGNVAGTIIQDDVTVAGLALPGHTFGAASVESPEFSSNKIPFDGLMGLAQSTLSRQKTLTPVEALAKAGLISDAIVSYKLARVRDNNNDGDITFGALDTTKFDPKTLVTVSNVNQNGFWEANVDDADIGGQALGLQGRTAILDTGTTLAILPTQDAITLHQQIPGSTFDGTSTFTVPCSTTSVVSLSFGGTAFAIDPRDLAFVPVDPANAKNGDCISGISAGNFGGATQWLLGATFLKNAYYSTDVGKNAITLAKLV